MASLLQGPDTSSWNRRSQPPGARDTLGAPNRFSCSAYPQKCFPCILCTPKNFCVYQIRIVCICMPMPTHAHLSLGTMKQTQLKLFSKCCILLKQDTHQKKVWHRINTGMQDIVYAQPHDPAVCRFPPPGGDCQAFSTFSFCCPALLRLLRPRRISTLGDHSWRIPQFHYHHHPTMSTEPPFRK